MNALSTRNDSPETASRPFSASRDGFVMGEGGACLDIGRNGARIGSWRLKYIARSQEPECLPMLIT